MSQEDIAKIRNRIFGKEKKISLAEEIVNLSREIGGISDILGREYEVYDPAGKLICRIRQKPMKTVQLNTILNALGKILEREKAAAEKKTRGRR